MQFIPRKLLFKAWNQETQLLMRLNSIDCVKGELFRKNHILLQFTGLYDEQEDEIYEMDLMLIDGRKYLVCWDTTLNGWGLSVLPDSGNRQPFLNDLSRRARRICNYFESQKSQDII